MREYELIGYVCLADQEIAQHNRKVHVIAGDRYKLTFINQICYWNNKNLGSLLFCFGIVVSGTVTAFSAAGAIGIGAGIWYLKKLRATAPVTCGVQTNDNRLF